MSQFPQFPLPPSFPWWKLPRLSTPFSSREGLMALGTEHGRKSQPLWCTAVLNMSRVLPRHPLLPHQEVVPVELLEVGRADQSTMLWEV